MPTTSTAPRRRLLTSMVVAVLVLIVAVVVLNRAGTGDDERTGLVRTWSADLDTWAADTVQRIGPEATPGASGHDLAAVFEADLTQPVRIGDLPEPPAPQDLDTVNAACTAYTSFIDAVRDQVQPPAPPPGLDTEHADAAAPVQRFSDYQDALAQFGEQTGAVESRTRTFCGTYPALVSAHVGAGQAGADLAGMLQCADEGCTLVPGADAADAGAAAEAGVVVPNDQIGAALSTQCYLPDLQPVCAADAAEAGDLARVWRTWSEQPQAPGAGADLAEAATITAEARNAFPASAADLGGDRSGVHRAAAEALDEIGTTLRTGAQDLADILAADGI